MRFSDSESSRDVLMEFTFAIAESSNVCEEIYEGIFANLDFI